MDSGRAPGATQTPSEAAVEVAATTAAGRKSRTTSGPKTSSTTDADGRRRWLSGAQIQTGYIETGKPWQNVGNESFNGKFRDERLSMELFQSREEALGDTGAFPSPGE